MGSNATTPYHVRSTALIRFRRRRMYVLRVLLFSSAPCVLSPCTRARIDIYMLYIIYIGFSTSKIVWVPKVVALATAGMAELACKVSRGAARNKNETVHGRVVLLARCTVCKLGMLMGRVPYLARVELSSLPATAGVQG